MCVPFGDDEADVHKVDSRSVNGVEQAREVSSINEAGRVEEKSTRYNFSC